MSKPQIFLDSPCPHFLTLKCKPSPGVIWVTTHHQTKGSVPSPLPNCWMCHIIVMLTPFPSLNTFSYLLSPHQILPFLWGLRQGAPLQGLSLWTPNFIVMTFSPETRTPVVHRTHRTVSISVTVWVSVSPSWFVPIFLMKYFIASPFPLKTTPVWMINWDHSTYQIHLCKNLTSLPDSKWLSDGNFITLLCSHLHMLHICPQ